MVLLYDIFNKLVNETDETCDKILKKWVKKSLAVINYCSDTFKQFGQNYLSQKLPNLKIKAILLEKSSQWVMRSSPRSAFASFLFVFLIIICVFFPSHNFPILTAQKYYWCLPWLFCRFLISISVFRCKQHSREEQECYY